MGISIFICDFIIGPNLKKLEFFIYLRVFKSKVYEFTFKNFNYSHISCSYCALHAGSFSRYFYHVANCSCRFRAAQYFYQTHSHIIHFADHAYHFWFVFTCHQCADHYVMYKNCRWISRRKFLDCCVFQYYTVYFTVDFIQNHKG
jgi:hypothetical protein